MMSNSDRLRSLKEMRTDWRHAQQAGLIDISSGVHQSSSEAARFERGGSFSQMLVISNSCVKRKDEKLKASMAEIPCR
jgi:hypothetical protein